MIYLIFIYLYETDTDVIYRHVTKDIHVLLCTFDRGIRAYILTAVLQ